MMVAMLVAFAFVLAVICIPLVMFFMRDLAVPAELDWEDD